MDAKDTGGAVRALMLAVGLAFACSDELSLEGRPCPCTEGWTCCESTAQCVRTSAECPLLIAPPTLELAAGQLGGYGTADGIGKLARFSYPVSITGDESYIYVSDGPRPEDSASSRDQVPRGVRRISRETSEVSWLIRDREVRHLTISAGTLFGVVTTDPVEGAAPSQAIVRIDARTGALEPLLAVDGVMGIAGRRGADPAQSLVYFTERQALRALDPTTGSLTTLAAAPDWPGEAKWRAPFVQLGPVDGHTIGNVSLFDVLYVFDAGTPTDSASRKLWRISWREPPEAAFWSPNDHPEAVPQALFGQSFALTGHCVSRMNFTHTPYTVGSGCAYGAFADSGFRDGRDSRFFSPGGIWCGVSDHLCYIADTGNGIIRKVDNWEGALVTIAGDPAHRAEFAGVAGVLLDRPGAITGDAQGGIVFSHELGIMRLGRDGRLVTLSPDRAPAVAVDGSGEVQVGSAWTFDLVYDGKSVLYESVLSELGGALVGWGLPSHDIMMGLDYYGWLAADGSDRLFVAQPIDFHGTETTIMAIDLPSCLLDDPGTSHTWNCGVVTLPTPEDRWHATALAYHPNGLLYVAEAGRHRVRALEVDTGQIFEVIGNQDSQGVQLGPLPASLNWPIDIAVLEDGALAIADRNENVILVAR
jgi:hypothetical protein